MAMMVRRRRRQPGDDGEEEEEADPEGLPLQEPQLEEEQLALEDGEGGGEEETLEGPKGPPTTLTPMTPLFTPEQLRGLHEVQSQAPHLYAQVPRQSIWQPGMGNRSPEEVKRERPQFLPKEEGPAGALPQTSTTTGTPSPALMGDHVPDDQRRGRPREPRDLKYKSLKVTVTGEDIPNLENNRWFRSKGRDREEEVYMFQEVLDKLAHLATSCPMKRGGDLCRLKEDGKFNYIPMALVRRIRRR